MQTGPGKVERVIYTRVKILGPRINLFKIRRQIWRDLGEPVMMVWLNSNLEQVTKFSFFTFFSLRGDHRRTGLIKDEYHCPKGGS